MKESRARVLEVVRTARRPVGVDEIAAAVGQKPNAVRHHLSTLEADELITAAVDRAGHRGRPRQLFSPGPGRGGPYEHLALALLRARRTGEPAEAAGRAVAPEGGDVVRFLAEDGFDPRPADDGSLVLAACPLARGVELDPAAVCGIHQGLVAAIAGRRCHTAELLPGAPGTCRVLLAPGGSAEHGQEPVDLRPQHVREA